MKRINELHAEIPKEISRLLRRDTVATFVDARHSPFLISFCDQHQSPLSANGDLSRLQALFAEYRLECNVQEALPWLCAVHFVSGRKSSMAFFYEGDYHFGLESAELMNVVVSDYFQNGKRMEAPFHGQQ